MSTVERVARSLHRRGLLRHVPVTWIKHHVYPWLVRGRRVQYEPSDFWEEWYAAADAQGDSIDDPSTISPTTTPVESRLHYAAVEITLLSWCAREGIAPQSVLDVGCGAGHWLRLYDDVFSPRRLVGLELSATAVAALERRFAGAEHVQIRCADIASEDFAVEETFQLVNAIGVLFHVVDDARWETALQNISRMLEPGGFAVIGGQFGRTTRNVQFHRDAADEQVVRIDKRIRSRRHWARAAARVGLDVQAVLHTQRVREIVQPESNLMVLVRR